MTLFWVDEGDGYQHAHETPGCEEGKREAGDFVLSDDQALVSLHLPAMSVADAKRLVEMLHQVAHEFVQVKRA